MFISNINCNNITTIQIKFLKGTTFVCASHYKREQHGYEMNTAFVDTEGITQQKLYSLSNQYKHCLLNNLTPG